MSRERAVEAFIIKKQDYGEANQIVTLFSKEEGKIRALVKAAKLPTSKLQPMLQPVFQTRVNLTGSNTGAGLAKVIGVQLITAYSNIFENEAKMACWYVASELVMRGLADSAPNENLFLELERYANFLHNTTASTEDIKNSIAQFQIKAIDTLGLGIRTEKLDQASTAPIYFSLDRGGFTTESSADAISITPTAYSAFRILSQHSYDDVSEVQPADHKTLSGLATRFVAYQLEREIKSHRLVAGV